jgi:hypothetical protein
LENIRQEHELPAEWPGSERTELLVRRADGLFIYAVIVCRFIGNPQLDPEERLFSVVQNGTAGSSLTTELDEIYNQILKQSTVVKYNKQDMERLVRQFRRAVGCIAILV